MLGDHTEKSERTLVYTLLLSLVIHILFIMIPFNPHFSRSPSADTLIELELMSPKIKEALTQNVKKEEIKERFDRKQIVAPSQTEREEEPERSRFLSERSSRTQRESVAFGDPIAMQREKNPAQEAQKGSEAIKERSQRERKLELSPSGEVITKFLKKSERSPDQGKGLSLEKKSPPSPEELIARARTETPGTRDYLPGIPKGEITLLNAKSFKYASFVRRVAYRVFDNFISSLKRHNLMENEVPSLRSYVWIEAIMDRKGNFKDARIINPSGSGLWDQLLLKASKEEIWDSNPPPGAETADGNIHFLIGANRELLIVGLKE